MFGFKRKSIERKNKLEKYHNLYLSMYKEAIDILNNTPHAIIKNQCIMQCRNIKKIWTERFDFDESELNIFDPIGIKI